MKPIINKWQFHFSYNGRDYKRRERGWKIVSFGVINLLELPKDGYTTISAPHKGFLWCISFFFPIEID